MNDPAGLSPESRALIGAASHGDDPMPDDKARIGARLARQIGTGVAAGAAATATSSAAKAAAGATAAASATAGGAAAGAAAGVTAKVVVAMAVVAGLGGAAASYRMTRDGSLDRAPAVLAQVGATEGAKSGEPVVPSSPTRPDMATGEAPALAPAETTDLRAPLPSAPARVRAPAAAPAAPGGGDTLTAELALMRDANAALRAGEADRALAVLDEHRQRYPAGVLAEERDAAVVLALCRALRVAEAREAADAFLREHPRSPQARRVATACESAGE